MTIQLILQSFYCTIAYSNYKNSNYFIYLAMLFGIISQLVWAFIIKKSASSSHTTINGVIFDSITFLAWASIPLIMQWSKLTITGIVGILFVLIGIGLVSFSSH